MHFRVFAEAVESHTRCTDGVEGVVFDAMVVPCQTVNYIFVLNKSPVL